jgi:hypothetical protein
LTVFDNLRQCERDFQHTAKGKVAFRRMLPEERKMHIPDKLEGRAKYH